MGGASLLSILFVLTWNLCEANGPYNVKSYTLVSPSDPADSSYFGYSVMLRDGHEPQITVGAPRAASPQSRHRKIKKSGALYICSLSDLNVPITCSQQMIDPEGEGPPQRINRDNMWLGTVTTGSQFTNDTFVVCAPRWVNTSDQESYSANGLCYALPDTTSDARSVTKLLPLAVPTKQFTKLKGGGRSFGYVYGQSGISVHLTEDNSLLIGAPGVYNWKGSVIRYTITKPDNRPATYFRPIALNTFRMSEKKLKKTSYFGYSLDSGHFKAEKSLQYVGGAPRGANDLGQVFIFEYGPRVEEDILIHYTLSSDQLGSYFGASLCVLDLNADGIDDLAVGAPMHSDENNPNSYDEGGVYIYLSKPSKSNLIKFEFLRVLEGDAESGARFGSALANLGDLDGDGYPELGIGAPYTNNGTGAMFVYKGSKQGLDPTYLQRILALPSTAGFGISISKGLDVDHNGCNEVAIGAYASGNAVVLRCHPTIRVHAHIAVPTTLNIEDIAFAAHFYLYANKSVPDAHAELVVRIEVEGEMMDLYNVTLVDSEHRKDFIIPLEQDENRLRTRPIEITMDYEMKEDPRKAGRFCHKCGLVQKGRAKAHVLLASDCRDAACRPDLVLNFDQKSIKHVIGSGERVVIRLGVFNKGKPAFHPSVRVELPAHVQLANLPPICRQTLEKHKTDLVCNLHNPLSLNKTDHVELELDVSKVNGGAATSWLHAHAFSSGEEGNSSDNADMLRLDWVTQSYIKASGSSFPEQVLVNLSRFDWRPDIILLHVYNLHNYGPTPWRNVELTFLIKTGLPGQLGNYTVVDVYTPKAKLDERDKLICKLSSGNWYTPFTQGDQVEQSLKIKSEVPTARRKRSVPTPEMLCARSSCLIAHCDLGYLGGNQDITVKFKMTVNKEILNAFFQKIDNFTITSHVVIKPIGIIASETRYEASTQSILRAVRVPSFMKPIMMAVLPGIVTLAILCYTLYKYGFFTRKKHDDVQRLKNDDSVPMISNESSSSRTSNQFDYSGEEILME